MVIRPADIAAFERPRVDGNNRYDIVAKAQGNATDDEMKSMVRTLLADRFQLKFHRDTREAPVLILMPGKTAPKLFRRKTTKSTR